jgi:hypothetical protein
MVIVGMGCCFRLQVLSWALSGASAVNRGPHGANKQNLSMAGDESMDTY